MPPRDPGIHVRILKVLGDFPNGLTVEDLVRFLTPPNEPLLSEHTIRTGLRQLRLRGEIRDSRRRIRDDKDYGGRPRNVYEKITKENFFRNTKSNPINYRSKK